MWFQCTSLLARECPSNVPCAIVVTWSCKPHALQVAMDMRMWLQRKERPWLHTSQCTSSDRVDFHRLRVPDAITAPPEAVMASTGEPVASTGNTAFVARTSNYRAMASHTARNNAAAANVVAGSCQPPSGMAASLKAGSKSAPLPPGVLRHHNSQTSETWWECNGHSFGCADDAISFHNRLFSALEAGRAAQQAAGIQPPRVTTTPTPKGTGTDEPETPAR